MSGCGRSTNTASWVPSTGGDIFFDIEASREAAALYGEAVARIVRTDTAAALVPTHPLRL